jgi:glycosyltransferase involved in cell wall biosynthesis
VGRKRACLALPTKQYLDPGTHPLVNESHRIMKIQRQAPIGTPPPAPEISVAIPIFNEEDNIEKLYGGIKEAMDALGRSWELILINDGSRDRSRERLDGVAARDPRVCVIHLSRNFGQTSALMAGLDHAQGEIIVPMDGDLQNDPTDIRRLLEKLDSGFDVVSGWRKDRKDAAFRRNLPSRLANRLISKVSGVHLHDYGCSLKAYRRQVLEGVKLYGEMHRFVPIFAAWNGANVGEIEVTHHPRIHGDSKYGLERVVKVLLDLLVVKFLFKYASKPIYVFGTFGLASLLIGGLVALGAIWLKINDGISFIQTPLPTLAVMLFAIGLLSILMGLMAEMLNRTYHESQSKPIYRISRIINPRGRLDAGA